MKSWRLAGAAGALTLALLCLPGLSRAECGPGPLITFNSKSMVMQSLGVTTNAVLVPVVAAGITIGTSGCNNSGVIQLEKAAETFVAVNRENVEQELAQGQGPYLASMAALMGCSPAAREDFARFAQAHYASLSAHPQASAAGWVQQLRTGIHQDPALDAACQDPGRA
jgi:Protein of unknown function (DUF3015)